MVDSAALTILETIVTTTGVLAGLLIVVSALVPERIRRKRELLYERIQGLQEIKNGLKESQDNDARRVIDEKLNDLRAVDAVYKESGAVVRLRSKKLFTLNTYNIGLLSYVVGLFITEVAFNAAELDRLVVLLSILTIVAFILIIPASYWSMIKHYDLYDLLGQQR